MNAGRKWIRQMRNRYSWFPEKTYIGLGWHQVIEELCRQIQAYLNSDPDYQRLFEVTLIKEKWGHLEFFAFPQRDEIERLIEEAGWQALQTCDLCGARGRLRSQTKGARTIDVVRCSRCIDILSF